MHSNMRKRTSLFFASGFALGLILLASAAIEGCSSAKKDPAATGVEVPSAPVAAVKRGSISLTLSLAGQFQPYQVVDIHPKVSGFIRSINVDIGDRVHKGQTLAVLEMPELDAQLQGSVSQVDREQRRHHPRQARDCRRQVPILRASFG